MTIELNTAVLKALAKSLRRDLKPEGLSYNQMLEAIARGLNFKTYAALAVVLDAEPREATAAGELEELPAVESSRMAVLVDRGNRYGQIPAGRLLNDNGALDLVESFNDENRSLVHGLSLEHMEVYFDDLLWNSVEVSHVNRAEDGSLQIDDVETEINWDGCRNVTDGRDVQLWGIGRYAVACSQDIGIVVNTVGSIDLEMLRQHRQDWRVRDVLIEAIMVQVMKSAGVDEARRLLAGDLAQVIASTEDTVNVLTQAQATVGFMMHAAEAEILGKRLARLG